MTPKKEDVFLNKFAQRGQDLRNEFANRYGRGFVGSYDISQTFRNDAGDMIKKVVETETKSINDRINESLSEQIQDEIQKTDSSVTRYDQKKAETLMSQEQTQQLLSRMIKDQDTAKKMISPASKDETAMRNVAAALKTTENATIETLVNNPAPQQSDQTTESATVEKYVNKPAPQQSVPVFDSTKLQSILDAARNASGFTGLTSGVSPAMFKTRDDVELPKTPSPKRDDVELPKTPPPKAPPSKPTIDYNFNELIDQVIGKNTKAPEEYDLSKLNVTYTKVTPATDEQKFESVIVSGSKEDPEQKKQEPDPEPKSDPKSAVERENSEKIMNPFEIFRRLYAQFYGVDYDEVEKLEAQKKSTPGKSTSTIPEKTSTSVKTNQYSLNYNDIQRKATKDVADIIDAQSQKLDMRPEMRDYNMVDKNVDQSMDKRSTVVNNNTYVTPANEERSTGRVFNNDNTFSRQSLADSQHPNYFKNR